jgi:hypothetical protein
MIEQVRACEQGFVVIAPDLRGRGTATEREYYRDWRATPYPHLLLEAEVAIFLEDEAIPDELVYAYGIQAVKDEIRNRSAEMFEQRMASGELTELEDWDTCSAGEPDDGAIEVHDVFDALMAFDERFPGILDPNDIHAVGLSGGGGTIFSLVTKHPDLLNTAASFFGISDYAYWYNYSNTSSRAIFQNMLRTNIGGSPDEVPDRYQARNSLLGAGNNRHTDTHLYWDESEIQCPGYFNLKFHELATKAGASNVYLHETTSADSARALHVYPSGRPSRRCLDAYWELALGRGARSADDLGEMTYTILGYLRTRHWLFILNDGRDAVAKLTLGQVDDRTWIFDIKPVQCPAGTRGRLRLLNPCDLGGSYQDDDPCPETTDRMNHREYLITIPGQFHLKYDSAGNAPITVGV